MRYYKVEVVVGVVVVVKYCTVGKATWDLLQRKINVHSYTSKLNYFYNTCRVVILCSVLTNEYRSRYMLVDLLTILDYNKRCIIQAECNAHPTIVYL